MRIDAQFTTNHLHYHDGTTCHGYPTLEACAEDAVQHGWTGRILEQRDTDADGREVACYSLVVCLFDHWSKHGKFVAVVERVTTWRKL